MLFTRAALALVCLLVVAPGASRAADPKPLNVVVLLADDWRYDTLGCAGNPILKTPNLDALAKDGFRFTHSCVTTSICGVSRASLLTGQWMSRHGNEAFDAFKTPWGETYPGLLRANGYWVGQGLGYTANDRLCMCVPLFHCFGCVFGVLATYTHGGCLCPRGPTPPRLVFSRLRFLVADRVRASKAAEGSSSMATRVRQSRMTGCEEGTPTMSVYEH